MVTDTFVRAIKGKKPAFVEKNGLPRYVILDWETYRVWEEKKEDMEDHIRFEIAMRESKGKEKISLTQIKKKYNLQ